MEPRSSISDETCLELLGGCIKKYKKDLINFYKLTNEELITIKYSHLYETGNTYWYGVGYKALEKYREEKITHIVLILGYEGILRVPIDILEEHIKHARISINDKGEIRHYHLTIKLDIEIVLHNPKKDILLSDFLIYNEDIVLSDINTKSAEQLLKEANKFQDYECQFGESNKKRKYRKESKAQKERIACLENHTCQVCGFYYEYIRNGKKHWIITIDHILDKAKGGGEAKNNLWVLCPNCHAKKTSGIIIINKDQKTVYENGTEIKIRDNHLCW